MKIKHIRTRVFEWKGKVVPPQSHFCTNAVDILYERGDAMGSFRFHGWLVVEIECDDGTVVAQVVIKVIECVRVRQADDARPS